MLYLGNNIDVVLSMNCPKSSGTILTSGKQLYYYL